MVLRFIQGGETAAEKLRVFFDLRDVLDGVTPETGEAGGQPEISIDGGTSWAGSGSISTLTRVGTTGGYYYAELDTDVVATSEIGVEILTRYKSNNTIETQGDRIRVVAYDPYTLRFPVPQISGAPADPATGMDSHNILGAIGQTMFNGGTSEETSSTALTANFHTAAGDPFLTRDYTYSGNILTWVQTL